MSEKRIPGLRAEVLCRKRYIDDQTEQAVRDGIQAVVILGAGMDTRACRMRALHDVPVYGVELPSNITRKRKRVRSHRDNVHFVPVDFETDDLAAA